MKSASAFITAMETGLSAIAALSSLPSYEPPYCAGIPIEIYRPARQLKLRFFPVTDLSPSCFHEASNNLGQLRRWARRKTQWALPTGTVNGVLGLAATGEAGLDSLLARSGDDWDWLDTLRSTDGQNRYLFFVWPRAGSRYVAVSSAKACVCSAKTTGASCHLRRIGAVSPVCTCNPGRY